MVESINSKILKVKTLFDFTFEELDFLTQDGKDLYKSIWQPQFNNFYLCGNKLVELDSHRETLLVYSSTLLDSRYGLFKYSINLPPSLEKWVLYLTDSKYIQKDDPCPWFIDFAISPYGNLYLKKIDLPGDIGCRLHNEVVKYNEPHLFLYFIYSYLSTRGFYFPEQWDDLVSKARSDFLTHELSQFIIYREQAIYLGSVILSYLHESTEAVINSEISSIWVKELASGLIKYSYLLPNDSSGLYKDLSSFDLAFFDIYPEMKKKILQDKYFSLS